MKIIPLQSHNLKVRGSNPLPATKLNPVSSIGWRGFNFTIHMSLKLNGNQSATKLAPKGCDLPGALRDV
jgi:hypothetical protein